MRKGFTLLELLIVVVVIGILAVAAVPQYTKVIEKAKIADAKNVVGLLRQSQMRYYMEKGATGTAAFASAVSDLDIDIGTPTNYAVAVATSGNIATATRNSGGGFTYTVTINSAGSIGCTGTSCGGLGL